jgi:hypothetical protein
MGWQLHLQVPWHAPIELSDDEKEEEEQRAPSSSPSEPLDPYLPPDAKQ